MGVQDKRFKESYIPVYTFQSVPARKKDRVGGTGRRKTVRMTGRKLEEGVVKRDNCRFRYSLRGLILCNLFPVLSHDKDKKAEDEGDLLLVSERKEKLGSKRMKCLKNVSLLSTVLYLLCRLGNINAKMKFINDKGWRRKNDE